MTSTPFGKFELLKQIGTGGMAEVFLARRRDIEGFEKLLVLKRLLPALIEGDITGQFEAMFLDEARLASGLNHPHIVQIYELGRVGDQLYIAMEHVNGVDLARLLRRSLCRDQPIPIGHAVKMITYLCEALTYAHSLRDERGAHLGLVHRDVSPQNVLLSFQGGVKLADFGIAKAATRVAQTRAGSVKGKLYYMSPEQVFNRPMDHRSDLFNLGILLYEMLTGERAFRGRHPKEVMEAIAYQDPVPPGHFRTDLPPALTLVLERVLAKSPDERYPDALSLQLDLERFLVDSGVVCNATIIGTYLRHLFKDVVEAQHAVRDGKRAITLEGILGSWDLALNGEDTSLDLTDPGLTEAGSSHADPPETSPAAPRDTLPDTGEATALAGDPIGVLRASEIEEQLAAATTQLQGQAVVVSPSGSRSHSSRRSWWRVGAVLLVACGIGGGYVLLKGGGPPLWDSGPVGSQAPTPIALPSASDGGGVAEVEGDRRTVTAAAGAVAGVDAAPSANAGDAAWSPDGRAVAVADHAGLPPSARHRDEPPPPPPATEVPPELEEWLRGEAPEARTMGRLTLTSTPEAEVWLGYNHLGTTPIHAMQLPPGWHQLRLRNSRRGLERSLVVQIESGKLSELKVDLRR